eukprot:COSAG02_NODE_738_length_17838_cov_10.051412_1_plen_68_part_00
MGMRPLDEQSAVEPGRSGSASQRRASKEKGEEWFEEQKQKTHLLDVDVALIDRFNPAGRGAALLKAM